MKNAALALLLAPFLLIGQIALPPDEADSLFGLWHDINQPDTVRLKAIGEIAWFGYLYQNPDSAFYYSQLQYELAEKKDLYSYMSEALNAQAASFLLRGDYDSAIEYNKRCLTLDTEKNDKKGIAASLAGIGLVYYYKGDYANSIDYQARSLKIKEELGDKFNIAASLNNIGIIYHEQKDYDRAMEYYNRSLALSKEIENKQGIALSLNNIGNIHFLQKDFDSAFDFFNQSIEYKKEIGDLQGMASTLNNLGSIYKERGNLTEALKYIKESLALQQDFGDLQGMAQTYNNLGMVHEETGNLKEALHYYNQAFKTAQEIGAIIEFRDAAKSLWGIHKKMGRYRKSLEMHELYLQLNDSIMSEENERAVIHQEYKYAYQKQAAADSIANAKAAEIKNAQIAQQEAEIRVKKNQQYGLFSGLGLMFAMALVFFKQRNRIAKEKERSEELLLNILPEEVAEELKAKGEAEAKLIEHVTVLFTDFKGFTAMSEQLSPRDLVKDLHECFSAFDKIMEKYGLEKIKTIGDAYMAAGGLPSPKVTHASDTIKAALEMRDFIAAGKEKKLAAGLPYFEIRIGIHTGPVVAGIVGVKKFQYDIWGDTVNTASRMESSGEPGKVNISESTYELVKDEFTFEERGEIEAKGKGKMRMYFVEPKHVNS